jgi:outer membrane receptor protein involved in Fe transport
VGILDTGGAGNYTTIDGYVRLRLAPRALLSLRVYDLGNERYEEAAGYPMPGRTFVVELSTR